MEEPMYCGEPVATGRALRLLAALLWAVCLLASELLAQAPEQSLGEVARVARKAKPSSTAGARIYDNDSLPKSSTVSVVGSSEPAASPSDARNDSSANSKVSPQSQVPREDWGARILDQERKIADLQVELDRLERDNRGLRAEYEDAMSGKKKPKLLPCLSDLPGSTLPPCVVTERDNQYEEYAKQHEAKKAELEAARKKLEEMKSKSATPR